MNVFCCLKVRPRPRNLLVFIFPVNTHNPVKNIPWVVLALIVLNTLLLIATYFAFSPEAVFSRYGFVPAQPQAGTLFSSMFLHVGLWHLLGNMWFLWMFGNEVENIFGTWLFGLLYMTCGLAAHGLHYVFNSSSTIPCVGASGAISGIAGIYFVLFPKSKFDLQIYFGWSHLGTIPTRARVAVGAWIGEQILLAIVTQATHASSVALWAHVGGFASGMAAALAFMVIVPEKKRRALLRAQPWFMQDRFNQEDNHITQLKL